MGTLRLLTFGLANTEEELIELCDNSKDGGACIYVEDYILKVALHRLGEPHVDLVLDARNFPDPHHRKITRHPGFYPENMNRIVENRNFKPFFAGCLEKMAQSRCKTDGGTPRAAAADGDCRLLPLRQTPQCRNCRVPQAHWRNCGRAHVFASSEALGETAMGQEDVQRNVLGVQK